MTEEGYKELAADQKKMVDRCLRAIPRTLDSITSVVTDKPEADMNGTVKILTTVNFEGGFSENEVKRINDWWG